MFPQFGSMFTPQFADHSWITDTKTFFPDAKLMWQNAALSLELCGLHNMYFTSNPYANMDFGTSLANIWNQAYQSANASMASSLGSFAAMQNFFPTFQPIGQTPSQAASDPAPKSTLTEEEKTEFEAKQAKFNELMEKYSEKKIDKAVAEKLGLDSAIKWAKEAFKKADTPEKVEKCIEDFEIKLAEIAEEKDAEELLELLPMKNESEEFWEELEIKVEDLYAESSDFESKIYNLICGADPVIKSDNVIQEMTLRQGKSCLIDELTSRYHDKKGLFSGWDNDKYEKVVETLVDALKERSKLSTARSDETTEARQALNKAYNKYIDDKNNANRQALVESYINLYNAVRKAEAAKQDKENKKFVKTLPDAFQERYLENGELRDEFKMPVQNDGFVLKQNPTETVGQVKKEDPKATEEPPRTPMAAAVTDVATNPFSVEDVDGVTGAARVAANMPFAEQVQENFWGDLYKFKY